MILYTIIYIYIHIHMYICLLDTINAIHTINAISTNHADNINNMREDDTPSHRGMPPRSVTSVEPPPPS